MAVTHIYARLFLDYPHKTYHGSEDTVTGKVVLRHQPTSGGTGPSNNELFGPLKLTLNFHGRAKTKIYKRENKHNHIYRGRAPLFHASYDIHDGPFRAQAAQDYTFPFAVHFPDAAKQCSNQGHWSEDEHFNDEVGDPLPPTCNISYHGFMHRFEAFTEYRIGASMQMPGIKIVVVGLDEDDESSVLYEQPRVPIYTASRTDKSSNQSIEVKNQYLLPPEDRPSGFKQKSKALFKSDYFPTYAFDVVTTSPQHLYLGEGISFVVRVKVHEEQCTAPLVPAILLQNFTATAQAFTIARAEKQLFRSPKSYCDEPAACLSGQLTQGGPFAKANDWTKTVTTKPLVGIPSTFSTYNIIRTYTLNIRFVLQCAEKQITVKHEHLVVVHPPLAQDLPYETEAGPSSSAQPLEGMEEIERALPKYERPPEYDENLEDDIGAPPNRYGSWEEARSG